MSAIWRSELRSRREIWLLNSPAIDRQQQLSSFLSGKFGSDAAALFAVPKRESDGSVTWTDPLGATETRSLNQLSGEAKDRAGAALRQSLQRLETACDGSPDGELLLSALTIESPDAIRITADGRPIIAGWGAIPGTITSPEQLAGHHMATLGPFLSRVQAPQFWFSALETRPLHGPLYGSRALLAAVAIAAIVLAWLLLPGVLRNTVITAPIDLSGPNRSIERQIDAVKRSLESNVCIATALPRLETLPGTSDGPRSGGTVPPAAGGASPLPGPSATPGTPATPGASASPGANPDASASPGASPSPSPSPGSGAGRSGSDTTGPRRDQAMTQPTPPVDPNSATVPPQASAGLGGTVLSTLLKNSTVIIVTKSGTGSGFFISRDQILTNRHVVDDADGKFLVGNKTLSQLLPADLVGASETSRIGAPDFALLKLRSGSSESFLSFSDSLPYELQNVIATGYPGFVISGDESFRRMMAGDVHSVPPTALTAGAVTFIQNPASQSPVILHYATISPGNSGGPLTDECGRVVGINTFVRSNDGANARMNYSLAASSAINFLKRFNITPTIVPGRCTTAAAGGTPAQPAPNQPAAPGQSTEPAPPQASNTPPQNAAPQPGAGKAAKTPPSAGPKK